MVKILLVAALRVGAAGCAEPPAKAVDMPEAMRRDMSANLEQGLAAIVKSRAEDQAQP
jgi:hypothetical protein